MDRKPPPSPNLRIRSPCGSEDGPDAAAIASPSHSQREAANLVLGVAALLIEFREQLPHGGFKPFRRVSQPILITMLAVVDQDSHTSDRVRM